MKNSTNSYRYRFSDDEKRLPWLPLLLDAYAVFDRGIASAIKEREKKYKVKLACRRGCDVCCRDQKDIPVYPLEMVGMYWYAVEKIGEPVRSLIMKQLREHSQENRCPFLAESACSLHPMRPAACRQFNVFNRPCAEGEDPFHTRRHDLLTPVAKYRDEAFSIMLPFYGITDEKAKMQTIKTGALHTRARPLRLCAWKELAKRMDAFDSQRK